jgi:ferredoxin
MNKKLASLAVLLCIVVLLGAIVLTKPYVNRLLCVGCGDCVKVCPTKSISMVWEKAVIDIQSCIDCGLCTKTCNYNAIRRAK